MDAVGVEVGIRMFECAERMLGVVGGCTWGVERKVRVAAAAVALVFVCHKH